MKTTYTFEYRYKSYKEKFGQLITCDVVGNFDAFYG